MTSIADIDIAILCGGKGTRLAPIIGNLPKVLAPIKGKPCVEYVIEHLQYYGAWRFVLLAGPHKHALSEWRRRFKPDLNAEISIVEDPQTGVGEALERGRYSFRDGRVLAVNGDTLLKGDPRFVRRTFFELISFSVRGVPSGLLLASSSAAFCLRPLIAYPLEIVSDFDFLDIGTPEGYARAESWLLEHVDDNHENSDTG